MLLNYCINFHFWSSIIWSTNFLNSGILLGARYRRGSWGFEACVGDNDFGRYYFHVFRARGYHEVAGHQSCGATGRSARSYYTGAYKWAGRRLSFSYYTGAYKWAGGRLSFLVNVIYNARLNGIWYSYLQKLWCNLLRVLKSLVFDKLAQILHNGRYQNTLGWNS